MIYLWKKKMISQRSNSIDIISRNEERKKGKKQALADTLTQKHQRDPPEFFKRLNRNRN